MALQPFSTALSRALALRLEPGSLFLGGNLDLQVSPSAQASHRVVLPAGQPIGASATALGLGLGASRFLSGPENSAFFSTPVRTVISGGGSIDGAADANASVSGRNDNHADATAVNVAVGQLDWIGRNGNVLQIGSVAAPFAASAQAASRSLLTNQPQLSLAAHLNANASVRGLEGASGDTPPASLPTFYGQPLATVQARAQLDPDPGPVATAGQATADARGIEGYRVLALSAASPLPSRIGGDASASLELLGAPSAGSPPLTMAATAIGIDRSALRGPGSGSLEIQGSGLATLRIPAAVQPASLDLQQLKGIGISHSDLQSNGAATLVQGSGGFVSSRAAGLLPGMDAAGIDQSTILTGTGDDVVIGCIATEADRGIDANGDGQVSPDVFLDASALQGGQGGFDGIRASTVNTGLGDDRVGVRVRGGAALPGSSASDSGIDTGGGDDVILLDRARRSGLSGGDGSDVVVVSGLAQDNRLDGGFGNDLVGVAAGDGNRLDGGYGQDLVIGGSGHDTFEQANAGSALDAVSHQTEAAQTMVSQAGTDTSSFAERLTDPALWNGPNSLTAEQKQQLWSGGTVTVAGVSGREDSFLGFDAARGDVLELSSTLGSINQALWQSQGALFSVKDGQLLVRDGPADSQLGLVVGSLADIRGLGIGSPSLAYATDTRQLMFDADGNWGNGGSRSLGSVSMLDPGALTKANLQFGSGA